MTAPTHTTGRRSATLGPLEWLSLPLAFALGAFGITLIYQSARAVLAVGGSCAEGGPYVIAVPCPGQTTLLTTVGILAGVAGAAVSLFGQRGFGPPAWGFIWAGLFGFGAAAFFEAAFRENAWVWHMCGWIFIVLAAGVLPMLFLAWPRSLIGSRALDGSEIDQGRFGVIDAVVVLGLAATGAVAGVYVAGLLIEIGIP